MKLKETNNSSEIKKKFSYLSLEVEMPLKVDINRNHICSAPHPVPIKAVFYIYKRKTGFYYGFVTRAILSRKFLNKIVQIMQMLMLKI